MLLKDEKETKTIRRTFSLEEAVSIDLDLYATALKSTPNWVINQALTLVFSKDKDFRAWKEEHPESLPTVTTKARKPRAKKDDKPTEAAAK